MKNFLIVFAILAAFALGVFLTKCSDNASEKRQKRATEFIEKQKANRISEDCVDCDETPTIDQLMTNWEVDKHMDKMWNIYYNLPREVVQKIYEEDQTRSAYEVGEAYYNNPSYYIELYIKDKVGPVDISALPESERISLKVKAIINTLLPTNTDIQPDTEPKQLD